MKPEVSTPISIRTLSTSFRNAFLDQQPSPTFDTEYGPVLRVLLHYIWCGCSTSRQAGLNGVIEPSNSLIALASYKSYLPILHLIRNGYDVAAISLTRVHMEQIAIVGYLSDHPDSIHRYFDGRLSPSREAMVWMKAKPVSNWMSLYGILSKVTHSRIEGPAGNIFDRTPIGRAFLESDQRPPEGRPDLADELLSMQVYSLMALDPLALSLLGDKTTPAFPNDPAMPSTMGLPDAREFLGFLQRLIAKYSRKPSTPPQA